MYQHMLGYGTKIGLPYENVDMNLTDFIKLQV